MQLQLLGPIAIQNHNQTQLLVGTLAKLVVLISLQGKTDYLISRSRLAGTLWPDLPEEKARQLLSNNLYRLKSIIGPSADILIQEGETIGLKGITTDLQEFESRLKSEELTDQLQGLKLYQADLAEEVDAGWVMAPRAFYRELYLTKAKETSERLWVSKQNILGISVGHQWALTDPLNETAYDYLIRFLIREDRQTEAMRQYKKLEHILDSEFGIAPLAELQELFQGLVSERALTEQKQPAANIPFIGRRQERGQLLRLAEKLAEGQGNIALIEGGAGIGKSRLIQELESMARWRNFQIAQGKGEETGATEVWSPLPAALRDGYQPSWLNDAELPSFSIKFLRPILHQHAHRASDSFPENLTITTPFKTALRHLIRSITKQTPLILILEDIHWGSPQFWDTLPILGQASTSHPLLVVMSFRPNELRNNLVGWKSIEATTLNFLTTHIRLEGLSRNEIHEFTIANDNQKQLINIDELLRISRGNPLVVQEFLRGNDGQSDTLNKLVTAQVNQLDKNAQTALKMAAVLGHSFSFMAWQTCTDDQAVLHQLLVQRFLLKTETGYCFFHDLIRMHLYQALSQQELQTFHLLAAHAFQQQKAAPETLAWHFKQAGHLPEAIYFHQKAAKNSFLIGAHESGRFHCKAADELAKKADINEGGKLSLRLLGLQNRLIKSASDADLVEIDQLEQRAIAYDDVEIINKVLQLKVQIYRNSRDIDALKMAIGQFLKLQDNVSDSTDKVIGLMTIAEIMIDVTADVKEGMLICINAIDKIEPNSASNKLFVALNLVLAIGHLRLRKVKKAEEIVLQVDQLIEQDQTLNPMQPRAIYLRGVCAQLSGDYVQARQNYNRLIEVYRNVEDMRKLEAGLQNSAHIAMLLCQFDESILYAQELLHMVQAAGNGDSSTTVQLAKARLITCYAEGGYFAEAEELAADLLHWLLQDQISRPAIQGWNAIGVLRLLQGCYEDSFKAYSRLIDLAKQEGSVSIHPYLVHAEAAYRSGNKTTANQSLEKALAMHSPSGRLNGNTIYLNFIRWLIQQDFPSLVEARRIMFILANKISDWQMRQDYLERDAVNKLVVTTWTRNTNTCLMMLKGDQHRFINCPAEIEVQLTADYGNHDAELSASKGKVKQRHIKIVRLTTEASLQLGTLSSAQIAQILGVNVRTIERDFKTLRGMSGFVDASQ